MTKIQMNFLKDWQKEIVKEIKEEGINFSEDMRIDSLIIKYITYLRKKGSGQPYKVYISKEFKCPSEFKTGLNRIINIFRKGGDISPYLSKKVDVLENDGMFNDWGVLHLHLGKDMEKNGKYIQRTGSLLFVYFKGKNVYLINIFKHEEWTKKEVLQTMYDNWPELIEPFILKEVQSLNKPITESNHQEIRNSGGYTLIEIKDEKNNNLVIAPTGFGIASSGDAIIDVQSFDNVVEQIYSLEKKVVKENICLIKDIMKEQNINIPETFMFKLIKRKDKWVIQEENTKLILEYY